MKNILLFAVMLGVLTLNSAQADLSEAIDDEANELAQKVVAWRRDIHEHPELSNREFRTSKLVAEHLQALGIEVQTDIAHTGVVGILKGGKPGGVVALRADMDGLPVVEKTGLPFASTQTSEYEGNTVGVMHACGHDNHVAILMAAAEVLASIREEIPGTIKFVFQPAEEGAPKGEEGGASLMIAEGVLQEPAPSAIFGLHIGQHGVAGTANYRPNGFLASAQRFDIEIKGVQTHGARPWAGVDPVVVAAQIINSLQTIVSRQIDITRAPAVVTVGSIHSGVRNNIIPETASLSGTIRTFDPDVRLAIHEKIYRIATNIGEAHSAQVTVDIDPGVPVTFNDAELTESMVPTLRRVYGAENVFMSGRITGAEDFSFYQEQIPGFFFFIGGRPPEIPPGQAIPNHSPYFYADEAALVPGVKAMSHLAVDYLEQINTEQ
ncbi:MAG: amidohydrolase [Pseudomonadales bacterium]|nr:amidohydrolase [Pseudomonadales bacterium]